MFSATTTPSSSSSNYSFGLTLSNLTQITSYSGDHRDFEDYKSCSLDVDQLAVLNPPHRLFSTPKDGRTPYAINSKEWYHGSHEPANSANPYSIDLFASAEMPDDEWESVYGATGVVYGVAKVFIAVSRRFRIDLHSSIGSVLAAADKLELELERGSLIDFIFAVEDLFSCLYARLEIELSLLDFCSSFTDNGNRHQSQQSQSRHQDIEQIYTILTGCKTALEDRAVCSAIDERIVNYYQHLYVSEMTRRYGGEGSLPLNQTGYRHHVSQTVASRESHAYHHWCQINPALKHLSTNVLAFLSEKYLHVYTPTVTMFNAPSLRMSAAERATWAENMKCAHRTCSLARIEGKSVGQLRREQENFNIMRYASEQMCICLDPCSCSSSCTKSGDIQCPCSGRWIRGYRLYQSDYEASFREKTTVMGELTFESLLALKRDVPVSLVQRELLAGINIIREEIIKHRMVVQAKVNEQDFGAYETSYFDPFEHISMA